MLGSTGMAFDDLGHPFEWSGLDLRKPLKIPFACCAVHSRLLGFSGFKLGGYTPTKLPSFNLPVVSKLADLPFGVFMVRSDRAA